MKKVLSYGNRKAEPIFWDISNEELFKKALTELFTLLDASWEVYIDLKEEEPQLCVECGGDRNIKLKTGIYTCPKCDGYSMTAEDIKRIKTQKELYRLAKEGDAKSIYQLLNLRKAHEYEQWQVHNVRS